MLMSRRQAAGGLALGMPAVGALAGQSERTGEDATARAIDALTRLIRAREDPPVIASVRDRQEVYLRANQRFPGYIEVGTSVWFALYDWQIHTRQVPSVLIAENGRYVMPALLSNFVLRLDVDEGYIGRGSDTLQ